MYEREETEDFGEETSPFGQSVNVDVNGAFCLTRLAAGGSSAFAVSFEAVSVGPGSRDARHLESVDMRSSFTTSYSKLETPKASKEHDMSVPGCFKEQTKKQASTTNSCTRQRVTFSIHLLHLFT